jgi:hypothetical protein
MVINLISYQAVTPTLKLLEMLNITEGTSKRKLSRDGI